ncbi:THAP domain-containing 11, partial [Paramuricea clavata]
AVQINEDSNSCENSCTSSLRLNNSESQCSSQLSSSNFTRRSGGAGGYTCCVPDCSSNHKRNPELSFYSIPSGKSKESKELRKRWINLISHRDFSPTIGHRVCSLHFPGGCKTYLNQLPMIVPKATRPTPTKSRSTGKARNRTLLVSSTKSVPTKRRLFSELDNNNNLSGSIEPNKMATLAVNENIDPIACLQEQMAKLLATNEKLKEENGRLKNENKCQKDEIRGLTEQLEEEVKKKTFFN